MNGTGPGRAAPERVVLVDAFDRPVGVAEKQAAHVAGRLHRAFSVFLFDRSGRLLLQQRAWTKYHSAGLWSNACCSHPRPGESVRSAARRRLREELGVRATLRCAFAFTYRADVGAGLVEHEYDHVLVGRFDGAPRPDPAEVACVRWLDPAAVDAELAAAPHTFTAWFRIAWLRLRAHRPLIAPAGILPDSPGSGPTARSETFDDRRDQPRDRRNGRDVRRDE